MDSTARVRITRPDAASVRRLFTLAVVAIVAAISMSEIDRLIGSAAANENSATLAGERAGITSVLAPTAWSHREAWQVWSQGDPHGSVAFWIALYVLLDAVLVAALFVWLRRVLTSGSPECRALVAVVVLEAAEGLLFLIGAAFVARGGVVPVATAAAVVTIAKWLAYAALIVDVARNRDLRRTTVAAVRQAARALWVQRLSAIVVAGVAVLALVPKDNIFDQGPDVVRSWFDADGSGVPDAVCAVAASWLMAALLVVQGRQRAERAFRHDARPDVDALKPAQLRWWLLAPAIIVVAALTSVFGVTEVHARPLLIAVGVPIALVVVSLVVRIYRTVRKSSPPPLGTRGDAGPLGPATWAAGDVLGLSALVVLALAVLRGLIAPLALGISGIDRFDSGYLIATIAAVAIAVAIPLSLTRPLLDYPDSTRTGWIARLMDPSNSLDTARWAYVIPMVSVVALASLARWPIWIGETIGVIAMVTLVLGVWSLLLGFFIIHLQDRRPLDVFRELRMEANPFLTVTAATLLLVASFGNDPTLHSIRHGDDGLAAVASVRARPTLNQAFSQWIGTSTACDRSVALVGGGTATVRPMLMFGASGGGIRAAEWTAGVISVLSAAGACGQSATLLSSGVSGGSVGLALTRGLNGTDGDPMRLTRSLGESDALATGLAGLGVGDLVAGSTGVLVTPAGAESWVDRAGLFERVWESSSTTLRDRYSPNDIRGPAGALIFNATSATSKCRTQISQVDLRQTERLVDPTTDCRDDTTAPAGSFDMLTASAACGLPETWATAAFVSARFPYVTPTARTGTSGRCGDADLQLVDGGYAEESGLGSIADLSPALAAIVRDNNAGALSQLRRGGTSTVPLVVPLVVYLDDEPGEDILRDIGRPIAEIVAPTRIFGPAHDQLGAWQSLGQRITNEFRTSCGSGFDSDAICRQAWQAISAPLGRTSLFFTVAPPTEPSVRAPLGWVLSDESHRALRKQLVVHTDSQNACTAAATSLCGLLSVLGNH